MMWALAICGMVLCFAVACFGLWMLWKRIRGEPVDMEWLGFKVRAGAEFALVALGVAGLVFLERSYSENLESNNARLTEQNDRFQKDLDAAVAAKSDLASQLGNAQEKLNEEIKRTAALESDVHDEHEKALQAQALASDVMLLENRLSLSPAQQAELDKLNNDFEKLNNEPTSLRIRAAYWPRLSGRKAVATYEIYNKDFEDDATSPRGAGLIQFASEQYGHDFTARLKSDLAKFICEAATSAIINNISPRDAILRNPDLRDIGNNSEQVQVLTDLTYLMMKIKFLVADSRILVRGYADGQAGPWSHPLDPNWTKLTLHEIDPSPDQVSVDGLNFKAELSTVMIGRPEQNYTVYANEDLPNLRASATTQMISPLVETCPPPAGLGSPGQISVEALEGKVFPDHNKNDRRAHLDLLVFLKEP